MVGSPPPRRQRNVLVTLVIPTLTIECLKLCPATLQQKHAGLRRHRMQVTRSIEVKRNQVNLVPAGHESPRKVGNDALGTAVGQVVDRECDVHGNGGVPDWPSVDGKRTENGT